MIRLIDVVHNQVASVTYSVIDDGWGGHGRGWNVILRALKNPVDVIMKQLILGGARSGKSQLAEQLARASGKSVRVIATADASRNDSEMAARIALHQKQRPGHWQTLETPCELAATLAAEDAEDTCLLVDCLTLWLSNCLVDHSCEYWQRQRSALLEILPTLRADILMIGNELGSGVVPMGRETREFVDENGFLHQRLAVLCDRVILTAAGLPLVLKGDPLV